MNKFVDDHPLITFVGILAVVRICYILIDAGCICDCGCC